MNTSIYKQLYVSKKEPLVIEYTQGSNLLPIEFEVMDWTIPTSSTAQIYIEKPSGALIFNAATVSGQSINVQPTTQMTAEIGANKGQLMIVNGGKILQSFVFILKVFESIIDSSAIESQDEFTALEEALSTVSDMVSHSELQGKGSATQPIYFDSNGAAQNTTYPLVLNALNQAGLVPETTSSNKDEVWATSGSGVPAWRNNVMKEKAVNFTDANDVSVPGIWPFTADQSSSIANLPIAATGFLVTLASSQSNNAQIFVRRSGHGIYERYKTGGTWGSWTMLKNTFVETLTVGSNTYNVSNGFRGKMTFYDSTASRCGTYFLCSSSGGGVTAVAIKAVTSGLTIDTSVTNKLTITNESGAPYVEFELVNGFITR